MIIIIIIITIIIIIIIIIIITRETGKQYYNSVVVGHGSQSMMGLSIDSSSVAMNLRTVWISKGKEKFNYKSWR